MKKITMIITALILTAAVFAGCTNHGTQETTAQNPTKPEATTSGSAEKNENTTAAQNTDGGKSETYILGKVDGQTYTSEFLGFGCKFDENFKLYSADMLQAIPENFSELMQGTEIGKEMAENQIIPMMAFKADDLKNNLSVNIVFTPADPTQAALAKMTPEAQIVDAMAADFDTFKESYKPLGMELEKMERVEADFLGEKHFMLKSTIKVQGAQLYTFQLFNFDLSENYSMCLTFSVLSEDAFKDLTSCFYKLG